MSNKHKYKCNHCGEIFEGKHKHCPYCKARIDYSLASKNIDQKDKGSLILALISIGLHIIPFTNLVSLILALVSLKRNINYDYKYKLNRVSRTVGIVALALGAVSCIPLLLVLMLLALVGAILIFVLAIVLIVLAIALIIVFLFWPFILVTVFALMGFGVIPGGFSYLLLL